MGLAKLYTTEGTFAPLEEGSINAKFGLNYALKGNSAEGNVISGAEQGLGRIASPYRDHAAQAAGGLTGGEVVPLSPFLNGDNMYNEAAAATGGTLKYKAE